MLFLLFHVFPKCLENRIRNKKNIYAQYVLQKNEKSKTLLSEKSQFFKWSCLLNNWKSSLGAFSKLFKSSSYKGWNYGLENLVFLFVLFYPLKSTGHSVIFNSKISYLVYSMQVINNQQLWNILVLSPSVSTHKQQRTAVFFAKKRGFCW